MSRGSKGSQRGGEAGKSTPLKLNPTRKNPPSYGVPAGVVQSSVMVQTVTSLLSSPGPLIQPSTSSRCPSPTSMPMPSGGLRWSFTSSLLSFRSALGASDW